MNKELLTDLRHKGTVQEVKAEKKWPGRNKEALYECAGMGLGKPKPF